MNTTDNNKMIAEFMGYTQPHPEYPSTTYWYKEGKAPLTILSFDTDWNWLMEVVEKIENIKDKQGCTFFVEISKEKVHIKYYYKGEEFENIFIHNYKGRTKKETLYDAVVEFIEYYNQQK